MIIECTIYFVGIILPKVHIVEGCEQAKAAIERPSTGSKAGFTVKDKHGNVYTVETRNVGFVREEG